MTRISDLHTHTTASDGQYTPAELVELANNHGIEVLAVTDHDTVSGIDEAEAAGEELGVKVIRGIELSANDHHNCHILGYGFHKGNTRLSELCKRLFQGREERKHKIIDFLHEKGADIELAEVEAFAKGGLLGKPHFAQAMVRRGYVSTNEEAFRCYLDTDEFRQKVKRFKVDACTCVEIIKGSGGKASLAHPYQMGLSDDELDRLVGRLKDAGLDAIECYYPKYTDEQQAFYINLADKYGLARTGGSDFHGEKVKPGIKLASLELDIGWILG